MVKSGRVGARNEGAGANGLLIERQADTPAKRAPADTVARGSAGVEDPSRTNIHTGGRADHQPVREAGVEGGTAGPAAEAGHAGTPAGAPPGPHPPAPRGEPSPDAPAASHAGFVGPAAAPAATSSTPHATATHGSTIFPSGAPSSAAPGLQTPHHHGPAHSGGNGGTLAQGAIASTTAAATGRAHDPALLTAADATGPGHHAATGAAFHVTTARLPSAETADAIATAPVPVIATHGTSPTTQLPVTVIDPVAVVAPAPIPAVTAPSLSVSAAVGAEDTTIPLTITSGLVDLTGTESLTVAISGLPEGATLSVGTLNADGSYTLTGDQLAGLTLTPAPDSGEDFTLAITATATDSITGVEAEATAQLPVTVIDAVDVVAPAPIPSVTAPSLSVSAAVGAEDTSIPLAITSGLIDLSDGLTLTVTITGLPEGATLSSGTQNADGSYTLTGDQLAGLTVTPAPGSGEDFTLAITATATDALTGVEAQATAQLPVTVIDAVDVVVPAPIPSVTAPSLSVSAAVGAEDTTIPLAIASGLVDLTGTESLTVAISGLPEGATLSAGTHNADGSYTLTGDQLAGLTLTPAPDSGEDFTLAITATATDSVTGVEAHATAQLPVTVIDAVEVVAPAPIPSVTAPSLSVSAAVGAEDTAIPLAITSGLLDLTGTETLTVTISGLPEGATLSSGTQNADGSYTLTGDQLAGLTVTPAPGSGEDFALSITATATDSVTGVEAHATAQLPVTVIDAVDVVAPAPIPAVTAPDLSVSAAVGAEDTTIPLTITSGLVDLTGTETLTVTIGGLPEGATLSAGTLNADGSYTLTADQLAGLTLIPAPGSGEDFTLAVTATATDSVTGVEARATAQLPVTVIDAVDVVAPAPIPPVTAPSLSVSAAVGAEDTTIPLAITSGLLDLTGTETLTVTISGLPEGATLSTGTLNADGSYTLTGDQLAGLTLTPAPGSGEDFTLSITATAADTITGVEAQATTQLPVTVIDAVEVVAPAPIPSVTAPNLSVSAAVGAEDTTIPLAITSLLVDLTGTETLTVTIGGLPEGATLSSGTQNPDGSYTLTGDQLAGLTLTPAPGSGEDFTLSIVSTATDTLTGVEAQATAQLPVTVIDAVDVVAPARIPAVTAPSLSVSAAVGAEDTTIPLTITSGLIDVTGTETVTVTIFGLPEGATLSTGTRNPDGSYTLTGDQLAGLTLTPAPDSGEDFSLAITATATDTVTGVEAQATAQLPVTVIDAVDVVAPAPIPSVTAPSLSVSAAVGAEDTTIPLAITSGLVDITGTETLTVTISGLPEGATLSSGTLNPDGSYTLTGDQLAGLTLTPAPDSGEDFTLAITATATDSVTGVEAQATAQLPVTVIDAVTVEPLTSPTTTTTLTAESEVTADSQMTDAEFTLALEELALSDQTTTESTDGIAPDSTSTTAEPTVETTAEPTLPPPDTVTSPDIFTPAVHI